MALVLCERHGRCGGEHVSRQLAAALSSGDVRHSKRVELDIEDMQFPATVLVSELKGIESRVGGTFDENGSMAIHTESQLNAFLDDLTVACLACMDEYRLRERDLPSAQSTGRP
jgi:hypothetical protein